MKTTIVIPTYNEAENLPKIAAALFALPLELDLLIVDDNSPDGTGEIAERLAGQYQGNVQVLHRKGKLGLGTAYLAGFKHALGRGAEQIVQMDADFSHSPDEVENLVAGLAHADLVVGSRYIQGGSLDEAWSVWRKRLSAFGNLYARLILGMKVKDLTGGFRAWKSETLQEIPFGRVKSEGYAFQVEMIYLAHLLGNRIKEIPIYFAEREIGDSKMSLRIQIEAALRVWSILFEYRDFR